MFFIDREYLNLFYLFTSVLLRFIRYLEITWVYDVKDSFHIKGCYYSVHKSCHLLVYVEVKEDP